MHGTNCFIVSENMNVLYGCSCGSKNSPYTCTLNGTIESTLLYTNDVQCTCTYIVLTK